MMGRRVKPRGRQTFTRWLSTALIGLIATLALFTVGVPLLLGAQPYTVLTGSMVPALEPGHLIGVRPVDIDDVAPGDIVTFQLRSGQPEVATHRVVGVTQDGQGNRLLITKGDANNVADAEPVQAIQLRGVVVYAVPWLGRLNMWATPAVKSAVVTAVGVGAIGYGILVLVRSGGRRRRVATVATVWIAAVVGMSIAPVSPARADTGDLADAALQLSLDGSTWTGDGSVVLFRGVGFAPGDRTAQRLWIRNASPDVAVPTLRAEWAPVDPANPADVALARALDVAVDETTIVNGASWSGSPIAAGGDSRLDVTAALPWETGMDARNGAAELTVHVTLTEWIPSPATDTSLAPAGPLTASASPLPASDMSSDLATTGGVIAVWLIAAGAFAVITGVVARVGAGPRRRSGERDR